MSKDGGAQINEETIRTVLSRFTDPLPENLPEAIQGLKCASVLIPLLWQGEEWQLLFTRRTDRVEKHKGQVAFPGGACDPQDPGLEATALRETYEEIGIPPHAVRILGKMPAYPTVTGFLITPVVGVLPWPIDLKLAEQEVSRAFRVPLRWLMDPRNRSERLYTRSNGTTDMVIFYEHFDGELIWGVTASIVVKFISLLG